MRYRPGAAGRAVASVPLPGAVLQRRPRMRRTFHKSVLPPAPRNLGSTSFEYQILQMVTVSEPSRSGKRFCYCDSPHGELS